MKLILTQDVSGLGDSGDVVTVKDGYARNYLVPRGLAIAWSKGAEKQIDQIRRARSSREIRSLDHAKEVAGELEALDVTLAARAHDGKLFGSITEKDVADAIRAAGGPLIEKRSIELPGGHIKDVVSVLAQVRLHPGGTAKVSVSVVAA